jgi:hypothetical protein
MGMTINKKLNLVHPHDKIIFRFLETTDLLPEHLGFSSEADYHVELEVDVRDRRGWIIGRWDACVYVDIPNSCIEWCHAFEFKSDIKMFSEAIDQINKRKPYKVPGYFHPIDVLPTTWNLLTMDGRFNRWFELCGIRCWNIHPEDEYESELDMTKAMRAMGVTPREDNKDEWEPEAESIKEAKMRSALLKRNIEAICRKTSGGAPVADIISEMQLHGFDTEIVKRDLYKLREIGELWTHPEECYHLTDDKLDMPFRSRDAQLSKSRY